MEHKHLIIRAELENPPVDQQAVEAWITKLGEGVLHTVVTPEGIVGTVVGETSLIAARFWNSSPTLLQMDVFASKINPTDVFDEIERFGVISKSFLFLDRTNAIQQIF
jgi:hypothetical protein